jgi:hypothetical protein
MKLRNRKYIIAACFLLLIGAIIFTGVKFKVIPRLYDFLVDNKSHYLSCEQLPSVADVNSIIKEHQNEITQIEQIDPGLVGIEIDSWSCPGKADIIFWYNSHENRLKIEKKISDSTFYTIPYRLQNR